MTPSEVRDRLRQAALLPGRPSSDYDLNPGSRIAPPPQLRGAAVLIAVREGRTGPEVILTKRSSRLKHHPGQIAFPGGKVEEGDADLEATALREAWEEIGLPPSRVEILGRLSGHETVTNYQMTPILGLVRDDFAPVADASEVEEVFSVPLSHVLDTARYVIEGRMWMGTRRRYFAVPYGPYYIWGATARILRGLAERAAP